MDTPLCSAFALAGDSLAVPEALPELPPDPVDVAGPLALLGVPGVLDALDAPSELAVPVFRAAPPVVAELAAAEADEPAEVVEGDPAPVEPVALFAPPMPPAAAADPVVGVLDALGPPDPLDVLDVLDPTEEPVPAGEPAGLDALGLLGEPVLEAPEPGVLEAPEPPEALEIPEMPDGVPEPVPDPVSFPAPALLSFLSL